MKDMKSMKNEIRRTSSQGPYFFILARMGRRPSSACASHGWRTRMEGRGPHDRPSRTRPIERVWKSVRRLCTHYRCFAHVEERVEAVTVQLRRWSNPNAQLRRLCCTIKTLCIKCELHTTMCVE